MLDAQPTNRGRQTFIVREDDHLALCGGFGQHAGQAFHFGWIHGLHGVVDDQETKRAFRQQGAGQEEAERERVQLTLAHHRQGGSGLTVDAGG